MLPKSTYDGRIVEADKVTWSVSKTKSMLTCYFQVQYDRNLCHAFYVYFVCFTVKYNFHNE